MLRIKLLAVTGLSVAVPSLTDFLFAPGSSTPSVPADQPVSDDSLDTTNIQSAALAAAREHRVDPNVVLSVMEAESCFQTGAVSPRGAVGLMQIRPETARELGYDARNWRENILAGTAYLGILLTRYRSDRNGVELAIAAYNAGPGAVARYKGVPPFKETRTYVKRVIDRYRLAQRQRYFLPVPALVAD